MKVLHVKGHTRARRCRPQQIISRRLAARRCCPRQQPPRLRSAKGRELADSSASRWYSQPEDTSFWAATSVSRQQLAAGTRQPASEQFRLSGSCRKQNFCARQHYTARPTRPILLSLSFMSHHAERISLSVVRGVNRAIRSHLATLSARLARA